MGDTAQILTATGTTLPAQITETRTQVEIFMKSEILNRENTVKSGDDLTIRYRTYSALSPSVDIYDGSSAQVVSKGTMTEMSTTGIYEHTVKFWPGWGCGDFTIVCSESVKGSLDALTITVLRTDLEEIAGQVSAVMGTTSGISELQDVAANLNSQFSLVEAPLQSITTRISSQLGAVKAASADLDSVYSQLISISGKIKEMTGTKEVSLEELYDVSKEKAQDITYLKNKTQELKAVAEINQKLIDNVANEPVTQIWYEHR